MMIDDWIQFQSAEAVVPPERRADLALTKPQYYSFMSMRQSKGLQQHLEHARKWTQTQLLVNLDTETTLSALHVSFKDLDCDPLYDIQSLSEQNMNYFWDIFNHLPLESPRE